MKGMPPTVVAPVLNILNQLDTELSVMGFECSSQLLKEEERLKQAIILMNFTHDEEDEDDVDAEIEKVLDDEPSTGDDEEEDLSFLDDEDE